MEVAGGSGRRADWEKCVQRRCAWLCAMLPLPLVAVETQLLLPRGSLVSLLPSLGAEEPSTDREHT